MINEIQQTLILNEIKNAIDRLADSSPISAALVAQLLNDAGGYGAITAGDRIDFSGTEILQTYTPEYAALRISPRGGTLTSSIHLFRFNRDGEKNIQIFAGDGVSTPRIELTPDATSATITLNGSPVLAERDLPLAGMWTLAASGYVAANSNYGLVYGSYAEAVLLMIIGDEAGFLPKIYTRTPANHPYSNVELLSPTAGPLVLTAGPVGSVHLQNTGGTAQNWKLYSLTL